jgi:hypothetical protein
VSLGLFVATNLLAKSGQRRYPINKERSDKEESAIGRQCRGAVQE